MSQALNAAELLNFTAISQETVTAAPAKAHKSLLGLRSSLLTVVATGAVVIIGTLGVTKLSDNIVEANSRAVAAAVAVPPAEYFALMAQMQAEQAAGKDIDEAPAATPVATDLSMAN